MKRFTVIGLGNFGSFVSRRLYELGCEVIAIDSDEDAVDRIGPHVTHAVAGDGTKKDVLVEVGVQDSDAAIVSTGDDLAASVLALLALRDLGIKDVYVKVHSEEHARIVDALGATESIFPERHAGEAVAAQLTSGRLLKYVTLGPEFGLQEMPVPESWHGKTLRELALPSSYGAQVVAIHCMLRDVIDLPTPERRLVPSDSLLVAARPEILEELARLT